MTLLLPGLYIPGDSALHRLDPRLKTAAALFLMAIPFAIQNLASYLILVLFVYLSIWLIKT